MSDSQIRNCLLSVIDDMISRNVEEIICKQVAIAALEKLLASADSFNAKKLSVEALAQRARPLIREHEKKSTPQIDSTDEQLSLFDKQLPAYSATRRPIQGKLESVYVIRSSLSYNERMALARKWDRVGDSHKARAALLRAETFEMVSLEILAIDIETA